MSQSHTKVQVCISLAPDQIARLDQYAAELDRSRSWVAGRAIEAFIPPSLHSRGWPAEAAEPPPAGRFPLGSGSVDRSGLPSSPVVAHHLNGAGGGRADLGCHFVTAMERQLAHDLEIAEQQRQTRDQVAQKNLEYLANMGKV